MHKTCVKAIPVFYLFIYVFIYNLALNLSSAGRSHVGLLFTNEEQKKSGSWRSSIHFCHICQPKAHTQIARHMAHSCGAQLSSVYSTQTRPQSCKQEPV